MIVPIVKNSLGTNWNFLPKGNSIFWGDTPHHERKDIFNNLFALLHIYSLNVEFFQSVFDSSNFNIVVILSVIFSQSRNIFGAQTCLVAIIGATIKYVLKSKHHDGKSARAICKLPESWCFFQIKNSNIPFCYLRVYFWILYMK